MTTNTTPPASNWDEFRGRLFESIERRRPIAATFKYADVYYFVTPSRSASNSPGTEKAQEALDAIAQNGSFRLVAESLDDFLAMLPSIQPLAGQVAQLNRSRHCQEADDKAAVQPEAHKDDYNRSGSGWVTRDECGDDPERDRHTNPSPVHRAAEQGETTAPTARPRSGRPF